MEQQDCPPGILFPMTIRILALGDFVGRPGRQVVHDQLPALVRDKKIDLVIANAENIAGGSGITPGLFHKVRSYGVDVVTLGDHALRRTDIIPTLGSSERLLRPANLPASTAGRTHTIITTAGGVQVCVFAVLGRIFMNLPADDPFAAADKILRGVPTSCKIKVCDAHAEASSEKIALGHYMDGKASFVFGTHTHVPTADAKILPGGTAFISDVGMCGPYDSVLGRRKDRVLQFMTTAVPTHFEVATGDTRMCGAIAEIDTDTGKAVFIERVEIKGNATEQAYDAEDKASGTRGGD